MGQVQEYEAKKSDSLKRKAEIPEQSKGDKIKEIEVSDTAADPPEFVQKDELKENVALTASAEIPEQVGRDETKKTGPSKKISDLFERVRRDSIKRGMEIQSKGEKEWKALEERGESLRQVQENWIIIPTVGVDAPILEGLSEENLALGVSHVSRSAVPGHGGNCIIEGHNLGNFGWWRSQGPFSMLEVLEKGVRIYVFYNGKKYTYKVKEQIYRDEDDPKLYDFSPGERLTLVTCTTTWDPTIDTDKRTEIVAYPEFKVSTIRAK